MQIAHMKIVVNFDDLKTAKRQSITYSYLRNIGCGCKNFQFRIGFVKFVVAHSILLRFVYFLARSNAVSIRKTTPVSKMRKYYFSVLVGLIRSILEGEYA